MRGDVFLKGLFITTCILFLNLFMSSSASVSNPASIQKPGEFNNNAVKIAGEVFIKNNAYEILRFLSDEIGARFTGSEPFHRSTEWAVNLFNEYGLTNVHLEYFDTVGWLPGPVSAHMLEPFSKTLVVDSMGLSVNTPTQGLIGEVIDVGHGTEEDFQRMGNAIQGKIVLCGAKEPCGGETSTKEVRKIDLSAEYEALACLIITGYKGKLTKTRYTNNNDYSPLPAACTTYEDGTWLRRLIQSGKKVKMNLKIQNEILDKLQSENVIAEIKGTERPEEVVILGAHIDTWHLSGGAADNGLGVAIVLESARIFSHLNLHPKRTIRFILFGGDEIGLAGSTAYVKDHDAELDNVVLMVNLDITGLTTASFINPYGGTEFNGSLDPLMAYIRGFGLEEVNPKYPCDSEDLSFIAKGVPAIGLQYYGPRSLSYAHTYADTLDNVDTEKLNLTTAAVAVIVYFAASTEGRLARRLTREEVIEYFKSKKLDIQLKKDKMWKDLGLDDER